MPDPEFPAPDELVVPPPAPERPIRTPEHGPRAAISSEQFPDKDWHKIGNLGKEGYVGIFWNGSHQQDAFAVDERSFVVSDGTSDKPNSGNLSRALAKKLLAGSSSAGNFADFRACFSGPALRQTLEEIRREQQAAVAESAATFSVVRDSIDPALGEVFEYASLGDSPIIVVERDEAGAVTGWQIVNDFYYPGGGESNRETISDKNLYRNSDIIRELMQPEASAVGIDRIGNLYMDSDDNLAKLVRTGRIKKKPGRQVIVASDALTKLLVAAPAGWEALSAEQQTLAVMPEAEYVARMRADTEGNKIQYSQFWNGEEFLEEVVKAQHKSHAGNAVAYREKAAKQRADYSEAWNPDGTVNFVGAMSRGRADHFPTNQTFGRTKRPADDLTFVLINGEPKAKVAQVSDHDILKENKKPSMQPPEEAPQLPLDATSEAQLPLAEKVEVLETESQAATEKLVAAKAVMDKWAKVMEIQANRTNPKLWDLLPRVRAAYDEAFRLVSEVNNRYQQALHQELEASSRAFFDDLQPLPSFRDLPAELAPPVKEFSEVMPLVAEGQADFGKLATMEVDPLLSDAAKAIIRRSKANVTTLQQALGIGYARGLRILDQMTEAGLLGSDVPGGLRQIQFTREEFDAYEQKPHLRKPDVYA